jgi:hypothetical protein
MRCTIDIIIVMSGRKIDRCGDKGRAEAGLHGVQIGFSHDVLRPQTYRSAHKRQARKALRSQMAVACGWIGFDLPVQFRTTKEQPPLQDAPPLHSILSAYQDVGYCSPSLKASSFIASVQTPVTSLMTA